MVEINNYADYLNKISILLKDVNNYHSVKIDNKKIEILKALIDSTNSLVELLETKEKIEPKILA
jgi:ppGpp synthetase/RelA/SpoT-type nucleotidyltranferase